MANALFHGDIVNTDRIIYTPSSFASSCLLHIQEVGMLIAQKPHISKRQNLASYLFFIVENGSGTLKYSGNTYHLQKGDCVFIDCNNSYVHETDDDLWTLKWLHFQGISMPSIYSKYLERGGTPVFRPATLTNYLSIWSSIYELASSTDYIRDVRINEGLSSLLTCIMEYSWHKNTSHHHRKFNIQNVKQFLDENYTKKITLDELSERYFINKYSLSRAFTDSFDISIISYVNHLRITHAKQLLRFSEKSIESISDECGFDTIYYFSRTFKQIEGISPSLYRSHW